MTRRGRNRRPKRISRRTARQERLLLEKEVRERYSPGAAEDLEVEEWLVGEAPARKELPSSGRSQRRREAEAKDGDSSGDTWNGRLVGLHSGGGLVEGDDGVVHGVVLSSRIAQAQRSSIAIGDRVTLRSSPEGPDRLIEVAPRRTVLARSDSQNPTREHLIAANVDVAVIVAAIVRPPLRPALIDRYLIVIERGGITPILWLNKTDLASDHELAEAAQALEPLDQRGIEVLEGSADTGDGLEKLTARLEGKTAVFVGHSGVGKSSLVRALDPRLDLRIGAVDDEGRGRHTTTGSRLHHLEGNIDIIDTPGIRELGLGTLEIHELRAAFPDVAQIAAGCRYPDCTHSHEPECAVQLAVEHAELSEDRLDAWRRIADSETL